MMSQVHILSATDRPDSNALKVASNVQEIYDDLDVQTKLFSLSDFPLTEVTGGRYAEEIQPVKEFNDQVLAADGLVMVVPEYNGGFPGILKVWIDYLPFPESFKFYPICLIGEADGKFGALRPIEQVQNLLIYRKAHVYPERVFIPGVNDVMDESGDIDEQAKIDRIKKQAEGFIRFISSI